MNSPQPSPNRWLSIALPALFVPLWSTGFIGAKFGLPYAEPYTFLLLRYAIVTVLLAAIALAMRAPWPRTGREWFHIAVAGLLTHAVYIGCVFNSIHHGLASGASALICGLQPLLTAAVVGPVLGEKVSGRQWLGLAMGLAGVIAVVAEKMNVEGVSLVAVGLSVLALAGITAGTVYQKRFCPTLDLRSGTAIQYFFTALYMAAFALTLERMEVQWTGRFIFAVGWLVLVLSVGAVSLLYLLIRRGAASRTAALFYLVPPCTAIFAYFLFDEKLSAIAIAGMALTALGVALATRPAATAA